MARSGRFATILGAALIGGALMTGCAKDGATSVSAVEVSNPSTAIVATDDGAALRISGTVVNASDQVLDNVRVTVVLDPALDPYLAAGAVAVPLSGADHVYPQNTASSAVPSDGGLGIEFADTRSLESVSSGLAAVRDLGKQVTLEVTWDGGKQTLTYTVPVDDPDKLLGS